MSEHYFIYKFKNGDRARCFFPVNDEEFKKLTEGGLADNWQVAHSDTCHKPTLEKLPYLYDRLHRKYVSYSDYWGPHNESNWTTLPSTGMKRKDISAFIKGRLFESRGGRGYSNRVTIRRNGEYVVGCDTLTEAKKYIQEGDVVKIKVYTIRGQYHVTNNDFQVVNDEKFIAYYTGKVYQTYHDYDPQKKLLYAFERKHIPRGTRLDREEIGKLYEKISKDFGLDNTPYLTVTGKLKRFSYQCANEVRLAKGWGQDEKTVLHELAHWLVEDQYEPHGPEFVNTAIVLYSLYMVGATVNYDETVQRAIEFGLKVATHYIPST